MGVSFSVESDKEIHVVVSFEVKEEVGEGPSLVSIHRWCCEFSSKPFSVRRPITQDKEQ